MSDFDFDSNDDRHEYGNHHSEYNSERSYEYRSSDRDSDDSRNEYNHSGDNGRYAPYSPSSTLSLGTGLVIANAYQFSNSQENYVFNIDSNNNVLSVAKIDGRGRMRNERIDADETYSVLDGYVIKEEVSRYGQVEWSVYADSNGDGRFAEVAEGKGAVDYLGLTQSLDQLGPNVEALDFKLEVGRENKVFTFDVNGEVTAVGELGRYGQIKNERIDANESYDIVGDFVVKTETSRYGKTEWSVYADGDNDGKWAEIAEGHGPVSVELLAQLIPLNFANFG